MSLRPRSSNPVQLSEQDHGVSHTPGDKFYILLKAIRGNREQIVARIEGLRNQIIGIKDRLDSQEKRTDNIESRDLGAASDISALRKDVNFLLAKTEGLGDGQYLRLDEGDHVSEFIQHLFNQILNSDSSENEGKGPGKTIHAVVGRRKDLPNGSINVEFDGIPEGEEADHVSAFVQALFQHCLDQTPDDKGKVPGQTDIESKDKKEPR
ncbi:hypothetical protein NDU88_004624 [Pleurodeles waltl]|uniref:Uncharacterized protein n=1 Tax=Pleurodeles waltl TaxID=8319 RepID=A0AAV7QD95_PLEWA|nr:hypothetical protein NDU88_004624 [Pleurodeles waltl]